MLRKVLAPGYIVGNRNRVHIRAGRHLVSRVKYVVITVVRDFYRSLHDGNARALDTRLHPENSASDSHAAVWRLHIQMAGSSMRRLHDDRAAIEIDSRVFAARFHSKGATLVHFHERTVIQFDVSM